MKGFAMLKIGATGWVEKDLPVCGPMDAICKPIALAPCTSDIHTVWSGAIGDRRNMILGHEAVGEVVEVGALVRDFKPGDRVLISAITPDWNSLEAQGGYAMHSSTLKKMDRHIIAARTTAKMVTSCISSRWLLKGTGAV